MPEHNLLEIAQSKAQVIDSSVNVEKSDLLVSSKETTHTPLIYMKEQKKENHTMYKHMWEKIREKQEHMTVRSMESSTEIRE